MLLVACFRIARSGVAEEPITVEILGETKRRTTRKIVPVTVPITTQPIMTLGPSVDGLGISVVVSTSSLFVSRYCNVYIPSIMWATPS